MTDIVSEQSHPTAAQIGAKLDAYRAWPYADYEGRAAFYAPDAVCFDPVGYPPAIGREAVRDRFRHTVEAGMSSRTTVRRQIIAANKAAIHFAADIFQDDAVLRSVEGIMVFDFTPDLLISRMEVFIDL